jgi:hypothetical protein
MAFAKIGDRNASEQIRLEGEIVYGFRPEKDNTLKATCFRSKAFEP